MHINMAPLTKRQELDVLRAELDSELATFKPAWAEIADFVAPRRYRANTTDVNKGNKRTQKIINGWATYAKRTLQSGMMSGFSSPARPWFKLTTDDPNAKESGPVKAWLQLVTARMSSVFTRSNLYNVLPICYGDMGTFGTGCFYVEEDLGGDVIRCYPFPVGEFKIATNEKGQVNTFQREFQMTVRQLVEKFARRPDGSMDASVLSSQVIGLLERKQYQSWVTVVHTIMPNDDYDPNKSGQQFKKYASYYYEQGASTNAQGGNPTASIEEKFLKVGGYDIFPVIAPRWEVAGNDAYGTSCPGMDAIGDVKSLQAGEKKSHLGIEKGINPPLIGPTSLKKTKASSLPGDVTYLDEASDKKGFRSLYDVRFDVEPMEGKLRQIEQRISRAFYEDLFLMLSQSDRRQITAREIDERHEEKLLALGPVVEQLNQDLGSPLIDITFHHMMNQGLIPPAPKELQGKTLKVEYVSIMAQAQKLVSIGGIERFAGFFGNLLQVEPEVKDKVDFDQLTDIYGEITSIPEGIVRHDDEVAEMRANRNQMLQQQQQMQDMQQMAMTAKQLSDTKVEGDSALTRIVGASGQAV